MNNAAVGTKGASWEGLDNWRKVFDVNVFGCVPVPSAIGPTLTLPRPRDFSVLNVQHTFVPLMLHQENPAVIINTGSKQGITNPP